MPRQLIEPSLHNLSVRYLMWSVRSSDVAALVITTYLPSHEYHKLHQLNNLIVIR